MMKSRVLRKGFLYRERKEVIVTSMEVQRRTTIVREEMYHVHIIR